MADTTDTDTPNSTVLVLDVHSTTTYYIGVLVLVLVRRSTSSPL